MDNLTITFTREEARLLIGALDTIHAQQSKWACESHSGARNAKAQLDELDPLAEDYVEQAERMVRRIRLYSRHEKAAAERIRASRALQLRLEDEMDKQF